MNSEMMNKMKPVIEEICDKRCPYAKAVNAGQMDEETFEAHCAGALDCPSLDLMDAVDGVIADEEERRQAEQDTEMDDHYDRLSEARLDIIGLIEESGEARADLIEIIGKELDGDEDELHPDRDIMLEAIDDVYNMLDQLCSRLNVGEVRRQEEQDTEMEEHYDRLCTAALLGLDTQLRKTKEELIELVEAIGDELDGDEDEPRPDREHTLEEIADVYNMLDQLCIIWDAGDAVWDKCIRKMKRTVERIESGYYKRETEK